MTMTSQSAQAAVPSKPPVVPAITRLHERQSTPSPTMIDQTAVNDVTAAAGVEKAGLIQQHPRYDHLRPAAATVGQGSLLQRSCSVKVTSSTPLLPELQADNSGGVTSRASKRHPTAHGFPVVINDLAAMTFCVLPKRMRVFTCALPVAVRLNEMASGDGLPSAITWMCLT